MPASIILSDDDAVKLKSYVDYYLEIVPNPKGLGRNERIAELFSYGERTANNALSLGKKRTPLGRSNFSSFCTRLEAVIPSNPEDQSISKQRLKLIQEYPDLRDRIENLYDNASRQTRMAGSFPTERNFMILAD